MEFFRHQPAAGATHPRAGVLSACRLLWWYQLRCKTDLVATTTFSAVSCGMVGVGRGTLDAALEIVCEPAFF